MRGYQPQVEVPPGEERTVEYVFTPRDDMEASDHTVCLTVFYEDDEETFSTQFFNSTVKFYEPSKGMDAESVFSIFLGVVFVGVAGFFATSSMGKKAVATQHKPPHICSASAGNDEDWVNSNYLESKTARRSSKGSPRKSKKEIELNIFLGHQNVFTQ